MNKRDRNYPYPLPPWMEVYTSTVNAGATACTIIGDLFPLPKFIRRGAIC